MLRLLGVVAVVTLVASTAAPTSTPGSARESAGPPAVPLASVGPQIHASVGEVPTSADCRAAFGVVCYWPQDIWNQYNITPLMTADPRIDGSGQTIVVFDAYGSPTIEHDLSVFSRGLGLPDPPSFRVYMPVGKVNYNFTSLPSTAVMNKQYERVGWAYETTLDVEWAHAIAPGASIALVVTPLDETQGVQGIPNIQRAQRWALENHIGTIWSNSWANTEPGFHSTAVVDTLDRLYADAAAQGVSVFFASGDWGVANTDRQGRVFPAATVTFPASSANVIGVGGTQIPTPPDSISSYQPEAVWNDFSGQSGGGFSTVIPEPSYQSQAGIADPEGMRGVPDVSFNAALSSSVLMYASFDPLYPAGWYPIWGTSVATPQWAGIAALANQAAGRSLGFLAPRLYQLYTNGSYASAFHDITVGDNSAGGITGYPAAAGWDPATGLGTPDVAKLVAALKATTP